MGLCGGSLYCFKARKTLPGAAAAIPRPACCPHPSKPTSVASSCGPSDVSLSGLVRFHRNEIGPEILGRERALKRWGTNPGFGLHER